MRALLAEQDERAEAIRAHLDELEKRIEDSRSRSRPDRGCQARLRGPAQTVRHPPGRRCLRRCPCRSSRGSRRSRSSRVSARRSAVIRARPRGSRPGTPRRDSRALGGGVVGRRRDHTPAWEERRANGRGPATADAGLRSHRLACSRCLIGIHGVDGPPAAAHRQAGSRRPRREPGPSIGPRMAD